MKTKNNIHIYLNVLTYLMLIKTSLRVVNIDFFYIYIRMSPGIEAKIHLNYSVLFYKLLFV